MYPWEAIARMVRAQGVEFTWGVGDSQLQLYAGKAPGLRGVNLRYEGSAPFMAMAYSRLSGMPGVCSASTGPGVANLIPGALEALYACSPLVMICPSVNQKTEGMGEFQECDQLGMMRPVTKWCARVHDVNRLSWYVRRAFSLALNDQPGPVFLEIPNDVGGDITHGLPIDIEEPSYTPAERIRSAGDPAQVRKAVDLLVGAKRAVIIAGNGAMLSGARESFRELVELLGLPFATTPGGRGIVSERHPLALGGVGLYRNHVTAEYLRHADVVLAVGTRNEAFQTHRWRDLPAGAKLIHADISGAEIGRNWLPDVGIVGDASLVLQQMLAEMHGRRDARADSALAEMVRRQKEHLFTEVDEECRTAEYPIPAKRVVHEVSSVFGDGTVLVNENGSQDSWSYFYPYYTVGDDSACVTVAEQTCMGMGVVGAIAAKLTAPDKNVVCITGDGAFQMYMKELPTAAQYGAACTWVVLNNSALGWPMYYQMNTVGWNTTSYQVQPDFQAIARASGCHGRRINGSGELRPALEEALRLNTQGVPVVLDVPTGLDMSHFERAE
jgi:acetolactate synthase-1/2/3 large subunit